MTSLSTLNPDFRDILLALIATRAEFLIVGAYAVSFHGHPRTTGDFDILVNPTPENAQRVWSALQQFGAPLNNLGLRREDLVNPDTVCQVGVPPRRIDLL